MCRLSKMAQPSRANREQSPIPVVSVRTTVEAIWLSRNFINLRNFNKTSIDCVLSFHFWSHLHEWSANTKVQPTTECCTSRWSNRIFFIFGLISSIKLTKFVRLCRWQMVASTQRHIDQYIGQIHLRPQSSLRLVIWDCIDLRGWRVRNCLNKYPQINSFQFHVVCIPYSILSSAATSIPLFCVERQRRFERSPFNILCFSS